MRVLARDPVPRPKEAGFEDFITAILNACADESTLMKQLTDIRAAVDQKLDPGATATVSLPTGETLLVDAGSLTDVMTRIRWRAIDRIDAIVTKSTSDEAAATGNVPAQKAVRATLLTDVEPWLDFLEAKIVDPPSAEQRYEHWSGSRQASVLKALTARSAAKATSIGIDANNNGKSLKQMEADFPALKPGGQAWCGMFAQLAVGLSGIAAAPDRSGSGGDLAPGQLAGEKGVLAFMGYQDSFSKSKRVLVGDRKLRLDQYHWERQSLRLIQVIDSKPGADGKVVPGFDTPGLALPAGGQQNVVHVQPENVDMQSGDILLLDNAGGNRPDHVMIATGYDAATHQFSKIAGNEVNKEGEVHQSDGYDVSAQPNAIPDRDMGPFNTLASLKEQKAAWGDKAPKDEHGKPTTAFPQQDELDDAEAAVKAYTTTHPEYFPDGKKTSRLAAVCRFSIVDYEMHTYQ